MLRRGLSECEVSKNWPSFQINFDSIDPRVITFFNTEFERI